MAKGKKKQVQHKTPKGETFLPYLAVFALASLAAFDLTQVNDTPSYIYFGLIGAALGAKYTDIGKFFGGGK